VTPTLRLIVEELKQLQEEFEEVQFAPKDGLIIAQTDAIELEDVALGPFAIELHVKRLARDASSACFDCVALEPNPASSNEDVTHPHVQSKGLCAGDAAAPINQALRQGRISDAFCMVRSVLKTYNPGSPYVALADWDGARCGDCERSCDREDLHFCEHCEHDYCDDCISTCEVCDGSVCQSCLERDPVSHRDCCPNCRHTCGECQRTVDADAYVEATGLCLQCHAKQQQEEEEPSVEESQTEEGQPQPQENQDHEQPQSPLPAPAAATTAAQVPPPSAAGRPVADADLCAAGVAQAAVLPARRRHRGRRVRRQR
jgi:hypothetical protein